MKKKLHTHIFLSYHNHLEIIYYVNLKVTKWKISLVCVVFLLLNNYMSNICVSYICVGNVYFGCALCLLYTSLIHVRIL